MKMAFYGSSPLSSRQHGTATYLRALLRDLAGRGYDITVYEPETLDGQGRDDTDPPAWAKFVSYAASVEGLGSVIEHAADADVVIKASGTGVFDDELIDGIVENAGNEALKIFWDMDAAATLEAMRRDENHPVRRNLALLDMVFTYGGGPSVAEAYQALGAAMCVPIYHALDPTVHHPVDPNPNYDADLSLLANRRPDLDSRVEQFFVAAADLLPARRFLVGGSGWETKPMPANVRHVGAVPASDLNAFDCTPLAVLDVARDSMANVGFAPAARLFEAAGAGACLITDAWEGIELFLKPDTEVLVARDGQDVAQYVDALTPVVARAIGEAALRRVLFEHTFSHRGAQVDALLARHVELKRADPLIPPSAMPA